MRLQNKTRMLNNVTSVKSIGKRAMPHAGVSVVKFKKRFVQTIKVHNVQIQINHEHLVNETIMPSTCTLTSPVPACNVDSFNVQCKLVNYLQ